MGRKIILIIVALAIATVGALLVFLYVQGVDERAVAQTEPKQVLTVTSQIAPGESVEEAMEAGKFELAALPEASILAGALDSTDPIEDMVATSAIYPGEQVIAAKFGEVGEIDNLGIDPKRMAVSVQLTDPNRVAGFVSPGSSVAVWVTWSDPEEQVIHSRLLLKEVKVLGTGQTTVASTTTTDANGQQTTEQIPLTILTLSVEQNEVEKLRVGEKMGELSLALRTEDSITELDEGLDSVNSTKSNSIFD
jgi:pilus assembly protein CpaB